jgi:hypothetical protein
VTGIGCVHGRLVAFAGALPVVVLSRLEWGTCRTGVKAVNRILMDSGHVSFA